jgi:peptidoglycan/LPS O-acetylase OafA/YrhL
MFVFGAALATQMNPIRAQVRNATPALHLAVSGGLTAVFLALTYLTQPYLYRTVKDIFSGVFAGYIIMCVVSFPRLQRALSLRPMLWLGDISYSFYLIHMPVLMSLIYLLYPFIPLEWIICLAMPLMLIAGHRMYLLVERPSLQLGRALSQRM